MNSIEAAQILGLKPGYTDDELNSAFRKLAAKNHPDVNKNSGAEVQFKRINEAYQLLKQGGTTSSRNEWTGSVKWSTSVNDFRDAFFHSVFYRNPFTSVKQEVKAHINISFSESILGTTKEVKYNRKVQCSECNGKCYYTHTTIQKCKKCAGKGERTYGSDTKIMPCTTCKGTGNAREKKGCAKCKAIGTVTEECVVPLQIPAGINSGAKIRNIGQGDYIVGFGKYNDAEFLINVNKDTELNRHGMNVISVIKLPLIDALKGTLREVRTIAGTKTLKITGPRKHGDQIVASGLGVPPRGDHVFFLNVEYPDNIDNLIEFLENEENVDGYIDREISD